jgi:hypothetical protein
LAAVRVEGADERHLVRQVNGAAFVVLVSIGIPTRRKRCPALPDM